QGDVKRGKANLSIITQDDDLKNTVVDKWIAERRLVKLLDLWVNGLEFDWHRLYDEAKPPRINLPLYPFAKESYWAKGRYGIETAAVAATGSTTAVLHPLLHCNASDLRAQRYRSTFTGDEFFLTDHRMAANGLAGRKVLPGVAYLEMARAAIQQALPAPEPDVLELRNVVWAQPIVVAGKTDVHIALDAIDDEQIDFEIYSEDSGQAIVHGQGRAVVSHRAAPARLDLEQLKGEMRQGETGSERVYAAFAQLGMLYGP